MNQKNDTSIRLKKTTKNDIAHRAKGYKSYDEYLNYILGLPKYRTHIEVITSVFNEIDILTIPENLELEFHNLTVCLHNINKILNEE